MKALFSIFSLTALLLQFAGSARGDNFKASLSPLLIVRAQLANGEFVCAQKFPNLVEARGEHNFTLTMGQVSVSHPRPVPLLKNSIEEISFFPGENIGEILSGNIVPNLQSSDPSPTSSATDPYLHRALKEGRRKEWW